MLVGGDGKPVRKEVFVQQPRHVPTSRTRNPHIHLKLKQRDVADGIPKRKRLSYQARPFGLLSQNNQSGPPREKIRNLSTLQVGFQRNFKQDWGPKKILVREYSTSLKKIKILSDIHTNEKFAPGRRGQTGLKFFHCNPSL